MKKEKRNEVKSSNRHQFIEKIQMEDMEGVIHLQIKIKDLWRKNYKLIINDNKLTISAIRCIKNKGKRSFAANTSSFILPWKVNAKKVWSDLSLDILHIMIPKINTRKDAPFTSKNINPDWFNRNQLNKFILEN